jgi:hypothetical protein
LREWIEVRGITLITALSAAETPHFGEDFVVDAWGRDDIVHDDPKHFVLFADVVFFLSRPDKLHMVRIQFKLITLFCSTHG